MKEAIRQRAKEAGFDLCRLTSAAPPSTAARFASWLASERHGKMAYLARNAQKRMDLEQVLPGVKSVVCVAASYAGADANAESGRRLHPSPTMDTRSSQPHGIIARYARAADYHDFLAPELDALGRFIDQLGGAGTRSLWYMDTGPVLERDLAQRAGLGFIGKHSNLIGSQQGNWLLLGEVLTTLKLEPDPAERNRCGSCQRCLDACPTRAIVAPFQLDARRCISYLTIELKGAIPLEFRRAIGNRIFGCDDCLAVCPWNRFARMGKLVREQVRPEWNVPDLIELLGLDDTQFKARFAGTPMLRSKRRGLLRNVCVALGNVGTAAVLPALSRSLQDQEPLIVEHAEWAIAEILRFNRRRSGNAD